MTGKKTMMNNRIRELRLERNWTQSELAESVGVSRASISAIEGERLVPSVETALALSRVFECSVEALFGDASSSSQSSIRWAWAPSDIYARYWIATIRGRRLAYPVETTVSGMLEHDGVACDAQFQSSSRYEPDKTLIIACCDPAASLLASELARQAGLRAIIIPRSSRKSLDLLGQGLIHVAGLHLETEDDPGENERIVCQTLGVGYRLLRLARWEEGLAIAPSVQCRTIRQVFRSRLRVVGREPGSGARQCLDAVMGHRFSPSLMASSHHGVVEAVRSGWADTGPCLRLAAVDAGLSFIGVRKEIFEFCFAAADENDARIRALIATVRSVACRKVYGELPGYDTSESGELREAIDGVTTRSRRS
jgi:molybdate-binding protein/DNA-binding XRE family transcriptional regulator